MPDNKAHYELHQKLSQMSIKNKKLLEALEDTKYKRLHGGGGILYCVDCGVEKGTKCLEDCKINNLIAEAKAVE